MKLLKLKSVSKSFESQAAVQQVSATVHERKKIGILGQTGAGKTSLMKMIAGLEQIDSGEILYKNEPVAGPQDKLVAGHEEIAYLSQHFELPKFLSVQTALEREKEIKESDAKRLYKACKITHLLQKDTRSLSGGEKQRVGLAMTLIRYPKLLLLDEPFSNLDLLHKQMIRNVIETAFNDWVSSIILTSHDPADLLPWADEIWVLRKGKISQSDPPSRIYRKPKNKTVAGLTGLFVELKDECWDIPEDSDYTKTTTGWLLRPDDFIVSKDQKSGRSGQVLEVHFLGSTERVKIQIQSEIVKAVVTPGQFRVNDEVFVSLRKRSLSQ